MPRRKNQSPNAATSGRDPTENVAQNSDVQQKWRDTTLNELQTMFSGSIDPEVVQLVLSESNYNVNDAVEKLFVLSGIEQGHTESKPSPPPVSETLDLVLTKRQKPNNHEERSSSDQSDLVVDSHFTESHIGTTAAMSKPSTFGNVPSHSSSAVTLKDEMKPSLAYNTTGTQFRTEVPRTVPSFVLPSSPLHSGSIKNAQVAMPPDLCVDSSSPVMSSGIPDFPDNISQQYKTLKNQAKEPGSVERLFSQVPPGHNDLLYNTSGRPPIVKKVPGHFEFGRPPDVTLHNHDQEFKGNLDSFLKQVISQNASTEDWKKLSHASSTEKRELDLELSIKEMHNQKTPGAHSSDNKTQVPYSAGQRILNSDMPMFSSSSQKVQKTSHSSNHNANKPHLQQKVNTLNQLPNQSSFTTLPKESMFRPPPAIQRQFPPYVLPQGFSRTVPGNTPQPRFALLPTPQSPWQQGPVVQRPMSAGRMPYQYPQGALPFQPQPLFGRAYPTAAARPVRQSFGVAIPFIPTIHQKLLILVRGLPGSGKSSLAQRLKGTHGVVLSADDFFYRNQWYEFDVSLLGEAHEWNQQRAKKALEKLQSPVIIDNTNTQTWEMKPYVSMALKYGYHIKFVEPDTSWKWNVKELARRNQHGVNITAIIRMKERYEHGVTVEKIINSERKLDASKTENESDARKGTGPDIQNANSRPQSSPQQRGSQELGTRKAESYGVMPGGATIPKVAESDGRSSLQATEGQNNLAVKEERFQGLRSPSENDVNCVEKSDGEAENGEKKQNCSSAVHGIAISELENREDDVVTVETDLNSRPKPQRVPRIRERKSPNRQQCTNTELSIIDCEDEVSGERQDGFTSCDNHNELDVDSKSSQENTPEEESSVFRVEKLSTLASLANSCVSSTPVSASGPVEDSHAGIEVTEVAKSSSVSPLSDSPLADLNSPVLNAPSVDPDEQENAENSVLSYEPIEGKLTSDVEAPEKKTSLPLALSLEDDSTDAMADSGNDAVKHREPFRSNSSRTPPPLSAILASASRTKLKRRSRSNSDPTQLVTNSADSPQGDGLKLLVEPNQGDERLELNDFPQSVSDDTFTQKTNTPAEDVSPDAQNLPTRPDSCQPSSSGNSQNDMTSGVEFLKTCFPDVDSELMNALLTAKNGDVMRVVDELLANGRTEENAEGTEATEQNASSFELSSFPDSLLASQTIPFYASSEEKSPLRPTEEKVEAAEPTGGFGQDFTDTRVNGEISSDISAQENRPSHHRDLGPRPSSQAQSPSRNNAATFQLTLEPAVALHLLEMFGSFAGVDFQEDITHEDLIIEVDSSLARQLYKKWEKSIQIRKGISPVKGGSSQRTRKEPTGNDSFQLSRDQASSNSQRSPSRLRNGPQAGNLRDIMDEQLALELSKNVPDVNEQDIATKLKRQKLYEMFPGIDPVALEEVFQANRYELAPSVEAVKVSCNLHGREIPNTIIASGFSGRVANQEETTRKEAEEDWSWLDLDASSQPRSDEASFQALDEPSYLDYRAEAFQHCKQRDECFKKAALAFSKKQGQLAQFYAQQGHLHTEKIKEANSRAAALILDQKNESTDETTIDLHGLHVTEAIEALEGMLMKRTDPRGGQFRKGCKYISVVTGRGNHSRGGKARIKPAILEYLKKHNYRFTEPHPGLVKVFL